MIRRDSCFRKKSGGLFAATVLAGSIVSSFGADTNTTAAANPAETPSAPAANLLSLDDGKGSKAFVQPTPPTPENPLSFFGGKLVLDLQERLRWENRMNNFDFNSAVRSPTDGNWFEQRFRFGVTVKPVDGLTFYAQGQSSIEANGHRGTIPGTNAAEGDDYFNLRQAYVQIANYDVCPWGLKIGRQELSYGDERLVGSFDWSNYARTFDAVKVTYQGSGWWVDAFTSTPAVIYEGRYDQSDLFNGTEIGRDLVFSGLYFSTDLLPFGTLDLYSFMVDQANGNTANAEGLLSAPATTGDLTKRSDFVTLGTRIYGDPRKLKWLGISGRICLPGRHTSRGFTQRLRRAYRCGLQLLEHQLDASPLPRIQLRVWRPEPLGRPYQYLPKSFPDQPQILRDHGHSILAEHPQYPGSASR